MKSRAFTVMELLVAIAIIAILAGAVISDLQRRQKPGLADHLS